MRLITSKISRKIAFSATLVTLVILVSLSVINYNQDKKAIQDTCFKEIYSIGRTLLPRINGDLHQQVADTWKNKDDITKVDGDIKKYMTESWQKKGSLPEDSIPAEYRDLVEPLIQTHAANNMNTEIYTLVIIDSLKEKIRNNPGTPVHRATQFIGWSKGLYYRHHYEYKPEMAGTFFQGKEGRVEPYKDENGEWISVYFPIHNSRGETVALLELDKKMGELYGYIKTALYRNLILLGVLSLLSALIMTMVSNSIIKPLGALTAKAKTFGEGDYQSEIKISSQDEVNLLAEVLDRARRDIAGFMDRIMNTFPGLILTIDSQNKILPHTSKKVQELFGDTSNIVGREIDDVLFSAEEKIARITTMAFSSETQINFESLMEMAPKHIVHKGQDFDLEYFPIMKEDTLKGIFVSGRDVTKENQLKDKMEEDNKKNRMMISLISNTMLVNVFLEDTRAGLAKVIQLLLQPSVKTGEIDEIFRIIHTVKGSAAGLNMYPVVELTHLLENDLAEFREKGSIDNVPLLREQVKKVEDAVNDVVHKLDNIRGKNNDFRGIEAHEESEIIKAADAGDGVKIKSIINSLSLPSLSRYVYPKAQSVFNQTLELLNKQAEMEVFAENIRIPSKTIKIIDGVMPHLIRNSLDHGIEEAEQRQKAQKDTTGKLELKVTRNEDVLELFIRDDGQGIKPDLIAAAALENEVITEDKFFSMSDKEKQALVFKPGFSSSREVSTLSGRGVGLDSVKQKVEEQGGEIEFESEPGKGTTFRIKLPITL